MKRANALLLCAALMGGMAPFALLGCGGCANQHNQSGGQQVSSSGRSPSMALSPEAADTYAYLVLMQNLGREDEEGLMQALSLLSKSRIPASAWLDGAIWLLGRRSGYLLTYLEQAMAAYPEDLSLNMLQAEALAANGMQDRAIGLMQAYITRHADATDAQVEVAMLLNKASRFAEAEALLAAVPQKARTALLEYTHARSLSALDRKDDAIRHLQRAIASNPDFPEALAELAFIHEQRGEWQEARSVYERLLKVGFSSQDVVLRLIHASLQLKQPDMALRYLDKGPENPSFRITAARLFMDAGHYLQAERLLRKVADSRDAPPEIFLILAELSYQQRRDLQQALTWLDKLPRNVENEVTSARAVLIRAQMLADVGQEATALDTVRQGRRQYPDMTDLVTLEARILVRMDRRAEALSLLEDSLKLWPQDASLTFLLGSLQDEMGRKDEAFRTMEKLLSAHPDHAQALNYVGYTLAEQNRDLDRAIKLLRRADSLAPRQAYIIDSLAWALFRNGQYAEALEQIRRAVRQDGPIDAAIWEHYGDIAAHAGLVYEARKAYEKALEQKPANAEALRQRLSTL